MLRNRAATDQTCVSAQSENIELAIRWLDTLINDPVVIRTRCCGFEGETYELDENGEVQLIYPEDGSRGALASMAVARSLCRITRRMIS